MTYTISLGVLLTLTPNAVTAKRAKSQRQQNPYLERRERVPAKPKNLVVKVSARYNNAMLFARWVAAARTHLQGVRRSRYLRDRLFMTSLAVAGGLVVLMWGLLAIRVRSTSFPVPVHYTTLGGFDALGSWYQPLLAGLYATLLVAANVVLSYLSYQRSRMASFFLLAGAAVVALFSLIITNAFSSLT